MEEKSEKKRNVGGTATTKESTRHGTIYIIPYPLQSGSIASRYNLEN
jgi:hypothetical protein